MTSTNRKTSSLPTRRTDAARLAALLKQKALLTAKLSRLESRIRDFEASQAGTTDPIPQKRHTPAVKRAFLLDAIRRYQRLHPSDLQIRLDWLKREFEERLANRPISNTTIYFAGVIDQDWCCADTHTRNRSVEIAKALAGLSAGR